MSKHNPNQKYENITLVLFVLSFTFLFIVASRAESYNFDGIASMTFPKWIIGIVIILCITKLLMNFAARPNEEEKVTEEKDEVVNGLTRRERSVKIGVSLCGIVAYAFLWNVLGFGFCTAAYVTLESKYLRPRCSWKRCLLVGLGSMLLLYFIFGFLFNVDFPEPILRLIFR